VPALRRGLGRQRGLIVGVVLQRRRHRAGEFHEAAHLARIHEAEFEFALGDHFLPWIKADDLQFWLERIHTYPNYREFSE